MVEKIPKNSDFETRALKEAVTLLALHEEMGEPVPPGELLMHSLKNHRLTLVTENSKIIKSVIVLSASKVSEPPKPVVSRHERT